MRRRFSLTNQQVLVISTTLCIIFILLSFFDASRIAPLRSIANYTVVPMEKGINQVGNWLSNVTENFHSMRELQQENEMLKVQVEALTLENQNLEQATYELERLQELYELDKAYAEYPKTAARIISKDSGNWFELFTIDKGSDNGIEKDMNVIANGGLVGIVIETGPNWSTVRSIIDDTSSVSAMTLDTAEILYIEGSLEEVNTGTLSFGEMENNDVNVRVGDTVVTSHVSSKYLPGINIGYISEIHVDSNNLTRSGHITPAADFKHLQEVLVITKKKGE